MTPTNLPQAFAQQNGQPFDLPAATCRICGELESFAEARGVSLIVEIAPETLTVFYGDCERFCVALQSLVRHAIMRARSGYVRVKVNLTRKSKKLVVNVSDNGGELAPSPLLDLSLARCLAGFLRGQIRCQYRVRRGAIVRLYVPFQASPRLKLLGLSVKQKVTQAA
jgi:signal transduction histidine kinase